MYTHECAESVENIGILDLSHTDTSYVSLHCCKLSTHPLQSFLLVLVGFVLLVVDCHSVLKDLVSDTEVKLTTEAIEYLYVDESSNQETRRLMKEAYGKGKDSPKLLEVIKLTTDESREAIRDQLSQIIIENEFEHQGGWKMAAVAAISIIVELAYDRDHVKDLVQAYWEAKDLLEFLDFSDNITVNAMNFFDSGNTHALQMSLEADIKVQKIERLVEMRGYHHHQNAALTLKEAAEIVREFAGRETTSIGRNNKFYQDWRGDNALDLLLYTSSPEGRCDNLKAFSMRSVCQAIYKESYSHDEGELVHRARRCLGAIIACAVLKLPQVLPQHCKKWATEVKEENLIKALEIQEKCRATQLEAVGKGRKTILKNHLQYNKS